MSLGRRIKFSTVALLLQTFFVLMFAFRCEYGPSADPKAAPDDSPVVGYPPFQDVHVMIFVGFGFLMTYLRRYGFTSFGINMFLSTLVIQWAMIVRGFIYQGVFTGHKFTVSLGDMFTADFAAATILISFGAVLGKTSPIQLLIMAMFETVAAQVNGWVCHEKLHAVDIGESMYIHAFGAYFGMAVSFVLQNKKANDHHKSESVYHSDLFSFIGTIFLWLFWPSFNGGAAVGDEQHRAYINTYLSLCACTVVTFLFSAYYDSKGKFTAEFIQNATLAGGVAVGTTANMPLEPFGAMCMGAAAGFISTTGFRYIKAPLAKHLRIHDTCGVHNLHGLPGVLAGVAGAIMAAISSEEDWGRSYYEIFPYVAPEADSVEYAELMTKPEFAGIDPGKGWSSGKQGGFQILALAVTLGISIVSGIITGLIMKIPILDQVYHEGDLFEDDIFWNVPEEEERGPYAPKEPETEKNGKHGHEMKSYRDWQAERNATPQNSNDMRL